MRAVIKPAAVGSKFVSPAVCGFAAMTIFSFSTSSLLHRSWDPQSFAQRVEYNFSNPQKRRR